MYILGISGHHRNAATALLKDGQIIAAIEEEKLARVKNVGINHCGGVPYEAIGYCLEAAGIGIDDIDYVTYYLKPRRLLNRQKSFSERYIQENTSGADDYKAASVNEYRARMNTLNLVRRLLGERSKVVAVDHQLAHAASAFYQSGFDRAAILILSGRGDYISIAAGVGEGRKVRLLRRIEFPHSVGMVYSLVTEILGFNASGGEPNTQWLGVTGEPEFLPAFQELIKIDQSGNPSIDTSFFTHLLHGPDPFSEKFYGKFGDWFRCKDRRLNGGSKGRSWTDLIEGLTGRPKAALPASSYRRNMAHSLQNHLEQVVLALAENVLREYGVDSLCLAGGVALNSLLVSKLEHESGCKQIFVQPAAGNSGCSIGSALFHWHNQLDQGRPEPLEHVFIGPGFSDAEVKPELDNCKLAYRYVTSEDKISEERRG